MKVRDMKRELESVHGASTRGVLEKDELARRLAEARRRRLPRAEPGPAGSREPVSATLETPLRWASLGENRRVAAEAVAGGAGANTAWGDARGEGGGFEMTVENTSEYATIRVDVVVPPPPPSGTAAPGSLDLLVDTACSGAVLRPEAARRCRLPALRAPVALTGAGGRGAAGGGAAAAATLEFAIQGRRFGPMPAAIQDVGALPPSIDGIVGVSFLSLFESVTMDFVRGVLVLKQARQTAQEGSRASTGEAEPSREGGRRRGTGTVAAETEMELLGPWGICSAPVWLGRRGPVRMLVDTGAACTLLHSPSGPRALGLDPSRDATVVAPLPAGAGAMGGDSVAIRLTHRLYLSSSVTLGSQSPPQPLLPGVKLKRRVAVDMGSIPFLAQLQSYQVGGILGMDVLSQCDAVEMSFRGPRRYLRLLTNGDDDGGSDDDADDSP
jgi:predicted aspartyl protease